MTIRQASAGDCHTIAQFNTAMALETEHVHLPPERILAGVEAVVRDRTKGVYYVAEVSGEVVGQLMLTYEWSDWRNGVFWWIQSVYVRADHRGSGVFRALYRHVETLARTTEGVCGLRLYVEAENGAAQDTYSRLGMTRTSYQLFETDFVIRRDP